MFVLVDSASKRAKYVKKYSLCISKRQYEILTGVASNGLADNGDGMEEEHVGSLEPSVTQADIL